MKKCCNLETSFTDEQLCDEKNVRTICFHCTQERRVFNRAERSTEVTNSVVKNKEANKSDQITGLLQHYYEGAPLFYSSEPRKAKVFKPVLLYHSNSSDDSHPRDTRLENLCESYNTQMTPYDSRHRRLKITLSDNEMHESINVPMVETEDKMEKDTFQKRDEPSTWGILNATNKVNNLAQTATRDVQSADFPVKNENTHKTISSSNETLGPGCYRSAFSKPRRFQDCGFQYSHMLDTYEDISVNFQPAIHFSYCCGFPCFSLSRPANAERCVFESGPGHTSHHTLCSEFHTDPLPNSPYTYNINNYTFSHCHPPLIRDQFEGVQFKIPVHIKTQDVCKYDSKRFWESDITTETGARKTDRVRLEERLYKCECGRAFARNEELTRHRRIHSGHRPFRCSLCAKTFGRKDHLKKHRTTHLHISEKKIHGCNIRDCQQRYTRSDALARHQWAIHGIKASIPK